MMKRWTTLLLLPLLGACSLAPDQAAKPAAQTIEVAIGSGPRLDILSRTTTRTALNEDDLTVSWQTGDRLSLWAVNSASQQTLEAVPFSLYHYNASYNTASFRGTVPAMEEDTYTYYAVSPVPASTDGLRASYDIPAVQDGSFHGEWDVMVAEPVTGEALREHDRKDDNGISDNTDIVNLRFTHKIHVLKISLPKNDLGEPISEIVMTFPKAVVGRMTVDASNPSAEAELSNAGEQLTLRFAEPKNAGDVVYAMIAPVTLDEGEQISIVASSEGAESETRTFVPANADRTFAAGHTTPILYNVPAVGVRFTRLNFRLDETGVNTLGEAINTFTVTAPSGWLFEDGNSSRTFDVSGTGDYTVRFREYPNATGETGGFRVTYDSDHALMSEDFTLPAVTPETLNQVAAFRVPYLFEEDFSGVYGYSDHDNAGHGWTSDTTTDAIDLGGQNLAGWSGARTGAQANTSIRVCCRAQSVFGGATLYRYHGRLDSAPLTNLKAGTTANVRVTFNYGGGRSGNSSFSPLAACGYTTTQGVINSQQDRDQNWYISGAQVIPGLGVNDSFTSLPYTMEYTIPSCSNQHRLSWEVNSTGEASTTNANLWLYIDNIRVSIAQ